MMRTGIWLVIGLGALLGGCLESDFPTACSRDEAQCESAQGDSASLGDTATPVDSSGADSTTDTEVIDTAMQPDTTSDTAPADSGMDALTADVGADSADARVDALDAADTGSDTAVVICSAGARRCTGLVRETCNGAGTAWDTTQVCGASCSPTACVDVAQIAAGEEHTCARLTDGSVKCWGNNSGGRLGDGSTTDRLVPTAVTGLTMSALKIAPGTDQTCALLTDNKVYCWGTNGMDVFADGSSGNRLSPTTAIPGLTNVQDIATGWYSACALLSGSTLSCWGANGYGQSTADGTATASQPTVKAITSLTGVASIGSGFDWRCVRLASDGSVRCWGRNERNQLGTGGSDSRTPVSPGVTGTTKLTPTLFAAVFVQYADGTVRAWGNNASGMLGLGSMDPQPTPAVVTSLKDAVLITTGGEHGCATFAGGAVRCWGANNVGQLGQGTTDPLGTLTYAPKAVPGLSGVVEIAAGRFHTCVRSGGAVRCWGNNSRGQLGDGTTMDRSTPVQPKWL